MIRKKEYLAKLLYHLELLNFFRARGKNRLIVFNYHRLRPDAADFTTSFDDFVYGATASEFRRQMQWLKDHAHPVSEQNIIECLRSKKSFKKPCALVTFDDGYRDNYTIAYPILKELGIPAIFFIPTDSINTRRVGHWDLIAWLLKKTATPYLVFDGERFDLRQHRDGAIKHFQVRAKMSSAEENKILIKQLVEACAVALPAPEVQDRELMNWQEILEVAQNNVTIGAHTHTHPCLSRLDAATQRQEMSLSKAILEEKIGQAVRSIAYPFGGPSYYNADTLQMAAACGYDLGFSFLTGFNHLKDFSTFDVKRTEGPNDFTTLAAMMVFPEVFVWKDRESLPARGASAVAAARIWK
jgi:peptidoglycan/xylan/chitin deacetylase (PgdA/CDA1 family)